MSESLKKALLVLVAALICALALSGIAGCATGTPQSSAISQSSSHSLAGSSEAPGDSGESGASSNSDDSGGSERSAVAPLGDSLVASMPETVAIKRQIVSMTLEQKVAQLFIVEPEVLDWLDEKDGDPMKHYPVGGFIYFASALESPDQTRAMLSEAQQRSQNAIGLPAFLCVDEEGGMVARVADNPAFGVANVGDMAAIGATDDAEAARSAATYIGGYLTNLGFNVDFAPVADLAGGNDSMALRSFGTDAALASRMVAAQVEGFLETGVLCSVKHFPSIGGVEEDSHETVIYSHLTMAEFEAGPIRPFEAGMKAGAPFVMAGHLSTPEATGDDTPASLSRVWLTGVLRDELHYDGIAITDSLGMGAVYDRYSQYELGALCLEAGADMLLHPADFPAMHAGILDAIARGDLQEKRIDESLARVLRTKSRLAATSG